LTISIGNVMADFVSNNESYMCPNLKIASWNVNSIRARLEHLKIWLGDNQIDILALQETKVQDNQFPVPEILDMGYNCLFKGQKSYNGVAILSRQKMQLLETTIPNFHDSQCRIISASNDDVTIINVYVPNGSALGTEKFDYKIKWLTALKTWLADLTQEKENLILLGDFNIAPDDADVHAPELWRDKILCSSEERDLLESIKALGLLDTFREFPQTSDSYSWWDYRAGGFPRNRGLRIDLILASLTMKTHLKSSIIDSRPRGWDKPSDHAPVILELTV
jgi:exodeoxyribonuclease III